MGTHEHACGSNGNSALYACTVAHSALVHWRLHALAARLAQLLPSKSVCSRRGPASGRQLSSCSGLQWRHFSRENMASYLLVSACHQATTPGSRGAACRRPCSGQLQRPQLARAMAAIEAKQPNCAAGFQLPMRGQRCMCPFQSREADSAADDAAAADAATTLKAGGVCRPRPDLEAALRLLQVTHRRHGILPAHTSKA